MTYDLSQLQFGDLRPSIILESIKNDQESINEFYSLLIKELLNSKYWSLSYNNMPRLNWNDAKNARKAKSEFQMPGLYLWGAENIPRYIGQTENSFSKRFNRYIWGEKSEYNLGRKYENEIMQLGIKGFTQEIVNWCKNSYGTLARLEHTVDYVKHGIENIWFSLFPFKNKDLIKELETKLIIAGKQWNVKNNLEPLLNK